MRSILTLSAILALLGATAATGQENIGICGTVEEGDSCTVLSFASGLPQRNYSATLESIAEEIESDFSNYLRETHGPYRGEITPTIDYELSFFSAAHSSSGHGFYQFVVLVSNTRIKPFGIIVLRDGKIVSEIDVSFGFSQYAIMETKSNIHFIGKDRFSAEIFRFQIN